MVLETRFYKRYVLRYLLLSCLLVTDFVKSVTGSDSIRIRCIRQEGHRYKCEEITTILPQNPPKDIMMREMEENLDFFLDLPPEERTTRHRSIGSFLSHSENELFADGEKLAAKDLNMLAFRLLNSTQNLAAAIARDLPLGSNTTIQGGKMLIFGIKMDMNVSVDAKFQGFPTNSAVALGDVFEIPFGSLQGLTGAVPISFVVNDRLGAWMTVSATKLIVSRVISVLIEGLSGYLSQPINFTMVHLDQRDDISPQCSFWQPSTKEWLSSGCTTKKVSKNYTSCSCSHLTSFAVLMDVTPSSDDDDSGDGRALTYITNVLLSISIICLLFSLITFVSCTSLYNERNSIHINFVLCLGGGQLVFVFGIDQTENKTVCAVVAGLLHFLLLCAFCWMLMEGLQIYRKLVVVFETKYSWTPIFIAGGYGVPTIIVAVCAGVNREGYGTSTRCWLSTERGFYWSFIGPVLAILLINIVILCIAVRIMWHHLNLGSRQEKQSDEKIGIMIKGSAGLSVLLGTGWLLGAFQIGSAKIAMAYIFTLLNCSQGVFIFGFHCLGNSKVRKEYRKALRQATWIPMPVRAGLYKLVASPSMAEMESISTSGVVASSTFSKMFRSTKETSKKAPEMSTVVTEVPSSSLTRKEESPGNITQPPDTSLYSNSSKSPYYVYTGSGASTDSEDLPGKKHEKAEEEKKEEAEEEKEEAKEEKKEEAEEEKKEEAKEEKKEEAEEEKEEAKEDKKEEDKVTVKLDQRTELRSEVYYEQNPNWWLACLR